MLNQTVVIETNNDQPIPIPTELRTGVERAMKLLSAELITLLNFEIDANWRFVRTPSDRLQVLLDLTSPHEGRPVGITGYPLDVDAFADDPHILAGLRRPISNFISLLSYLNKLEVRHDRERVLSSLVGAN